VESASDGRYRIFAVIDSDLGESGIHNYTNDLRSSPFTPRLSVLEGKSFISVS
jgi:hypothetical protein